MACNVKDFGAIGDGITNDTTPVRNALLACKCVYFPEGTYSVDLSGGSFSLTDSQQVYGDGFSTVIKSRNTSSNPVFLLPSSGARNIIRDMILEGHSSSVYAGVGIQIGDNNFSGIHRLYNITCRYFDKGIRLSGALFTNIYDCLFDANNYGEVYETLGQIYSTTVSHYSCSFNNNKRNGIAGLTVPVRNICLAYYSCLIENNCQIVASTEPQIKLGHAAQITFNGCYFEDSKSTKSDTILTNGMSQFTISNCYFNGANRHLYGSAASNAGVINSNRFLTTVGANSVNLAASNDQIHAFGNESDKSIIINGTTCSVITKRIAQVP